MNGAERRAVAAVVAEAVEGALSLYRSEREGGADEAKARMVAAERAVPEALERLDALLDDGSEGSAGAGDEDAPPGSEDLVLRRTAELLNLQARHAGALAARTRRAVESAARRLPGCPILPALRFDARRDDRMEFRVRSLYPSARPERTVVVEWIDDGTGQKPSVKVTRKRDRARPDEGGA